MSIVKSTASRPVIVLDSNVVMPDFLLRGASFRLLRSMVFADQIDVAVPAPVIEELCAAFERQRDEAERSLATARSKLTRMGIEVGPLTIPQFDYRAHLMRILTEVLEFELIPWPDVPHAEITRRAANRVAPFDANGGGYRDTLIWFCAKSLALRGRKVLLVSQDKAYRGADGGLAPSLISELKNDAGNAELIVDLRRWLSAQVPRWGDDLERALRDRQDREAAALLMESEILHALDADPFWTGFVEMEIQEIDWDGRCKRVSSGATGTDLLVDYDIEVRLGVEGLLPRDLIYRFEWANVAREGIGLVVVRGDVRCTVSILAVFDPYGACVGIESFEIVSAEPARPRPADPIPGQLEIFEDFED